MTLFVSSARMGLLALCWTACADASTSPNPAPDTRETDSAAPDTAPEPDVATDVAPEPERGWWELGMADPFLDELTLYYLGASAFGGSEVAEVLETAKRVSDDTPELWSAAWQASAQRLLEVADASEARGHRLTAARAYFRSSTYLRAAMHYYPDPHDPDLKPLAEAAVARFTKFMERVYPTNSEVLEVPYEGTTLIGYYFRGAAPGTKAPTIIAHSGRDAWAEDLLYTANAGLERGYNVLLIDGPGQGKVMRIQGLPFRHDWETFITPVVDTLLSRAEVDPAAIVLMGASMGGYLAPRAAAFEPRIAYLVANPGVVSWNDAVLATLKTYLPDFEAVFAQGPAAFDPYINGFLDYSPFLRWGFEDMAWHHGVDTPYTFVAGMAPYTLAGHVADIAAKTLVIDAEDEGSRGQAQLLYQQLDPTRRDLVVFTRAEAAQFHVQPGATTILTHKVFDWLDEKLANSR